MEKYNIYLAHSKQSKAKIHSICEKKEIRRWLFLGASYHERKSWANVLGASGFIPIGKLLQKSAWNLRRPYVNWDSALSANYQNNVSWWISWMWERSPLVNHIFLYLCYLDVLEFICGSFQSEDILVICGEESIIHAITLNRHRLNKNIIQLPGQKTAFLHERVFKAFLFGKRWLSWIRRTINEYYAARVTREIKQIPLWRTPSSRPKALIQSCIDSAAFGKDDVFHDRYFGGLYDYLEKRGYDVAYLTWIYEIDKPLKYAYQWLRKNRKTFIFYEDYAKLADYFWALLQVLRQARVGSGTHVIAGWNINPFVGALRRQQAGNFGAFRFLIYNRIIKRWAKNKKTFDIYVDRFENMASEKAQLMAIRNEMPKTKIVGYQHGGIYPFFLNYATTAEEVDTKIYPDVIVTAGSRFAEKLFNDGFPKEMLRVGPPVRMEHLFVKQGKIYGDETKDIIILLPIDYSMSVELLDRVYAAFPNREIMIKCHPMTSKASVLSLLGWNSLPSGWQWAEYSMDDVISRAGCVITAYSSTILECVIKGIPTIVIACEATLPHDPLLWDEHDGFESPVITAYNTDDLARAVDKALGLSLAERKSLNSIGQDVLKRWFGAGDFKGFDVFIP